MISEYLYEQIRNTSSQPDLCTAEQSLVHDAKARSDLKESYRLTDQILRRKLYWRRNNSTNRSIKL